MFIKVDFSTPERTNSVNSFRVYILETVVLIDNEAQLFERPRDFGSGFANVRKFGKIENELVRSESSICLRFDNSVKLEQFDEFGWKINVNLRVIYIITPVSTGVFYECYVPGNTMESKK